MTVGQQKIIRRRREKRERKSTSTKLIIRTMVRKKAGCQETEVSRHK
jgi:hypothetical protein